MANRKRTNYVYKALGRKLKIELHEPTPKNPGRAHVTDCFDMIVECSVEHHKSTPPTTHIQ
jgi:hypothetical protein